MASLIKKVFSTFLARFFNAGANFAIAIMVSHFMGPSGRGEQSLFITLITLIIIISGMIGSASISYLIPRFPFSLLIRPTYIWACLVTVLCMVFLPFTNLIPGEYVIHVSLLSLILSLFYAHNSVLIAKQRINTSNLLTALQSFIIILVLGIMFAGYNEKTIHSYIISLYAGYGISFLISIWSIRKYFGNGKSEIPWFLAFKKLTQLGIYNQIAVFTQMLSFRLSYYILNTYGGNSEVGIYSNAVSVAESIWLVGRSISVVQHSRIVNTNDDIYARKLTKQMNMLNMTVSGVLLLLMAFIPSSWYQWIFGKEFVGLNKMIWIISPGILFFGVALIVGYYFSSTGRHYVNAIASTVGLIITFILGFSFIPLFGGSGAALTASISYGVTALIVVLFFRRRGKLVEEKKFS